MDAIFNNVSPAALQLANRYVKLHIGDPGEAGTANPATETTRKAMGAAASVDGVYTLPVALEWAGYPTAETITHISIWDNLTAGNCLGSGALSAGVLAVVGSPFRLTTATTVTFT